MARSVTIHLKGLRETMQALRRLGPATDQAVASGLFQVGEQIMADSIDNYVPVDTGTLRGTGQVRLPEQVGSTIQVTLGYGGPAAPYAESVHENPRAGQTGGWGPVRQEPHWVTIKGRPVLIGGQRRSWATVGGWKYLEIPFNAVASRLDQHLAAAVRRAIQALRR